MTPTARERVKELERYVEELEQEVASWRGIAEAFGDELATGDPVEPAWEFVDHHHRRLRVLQQIAERARMIVGQGQPTAEAMRELGVAVAELEELDTRRG